MLLQDVRYALRSLWVSKTFTIVAILCLAFGVGLNTTIFSVVDGVLLKPFPYQDPDRIVVLRSANETLGVTRGSLSYPDWQDLSATKSAFETIAAMQFRSIALADAGHEPTRYTAGAISPNLFPLLGVSPVVGTGFTAEDDRPGAEGVVLLSHTVWRDRYQSDPNIRGLRVFLNGKPAIVVGVMPPHFEFPNNQKLWVPLGPLMTQETRQQRTLYVFGKLSAGSSVAGGARELTTKAAKLSEQYPESNAGWTVYPRSLRDEFIPPDVSRVIWIMMASVTLVLLIACSNVANLQLARAATRVREFSVRAALGAGRKRIVRQLLTESVVLSVLSLPLGIVLAQIGTRLIASAMPPNQVPYYITWSMDWRSMLYAFTVAVVTAVIFGFLPAVQSSKSNLVETLKEGARGTSVRRSKLRSALVVVQVSLALVSLVGALLFVRTFANLDSYEVGFDPKPIATTRFYMPGDAYEVKDAKARRVEDVVRRVEALPHVTAAFASNLVPISGGGLTAAIAIDGQPTERGKEPFANVAGVTPHFLKTLGIKPTRGRDFTDAEGWSSQLLAVVNTTMADRFWPSGGAVGGRFRMPDAEEPLASQWFTVIGVAPDVKHDDVDPGEEPYPAAYIPYWYQQTFSAGLTVRVDGDPIAIASSVREALRASDPNMPMNLMQTMEEVRQIGFWQYGLFGWIFGVTGIVGLVLAAVGVYGVLSYNVSQRSSEIGVRMALGAARRDVLRLIVGHGVMLAAIGVGVGLVIAPLGTWFGRSLFYNVSPFDPLTFGSVAIFLLTVAVIASYMPARRAMKVNPVQALRE